MTRLLIAGVGPGPRPGLHRVFAPGLRLHSITRQLVAAGHDVCLCEALFPGAESPSAEDPFTEMHVRLSHDPGQVAETISHETQSFRADAVIALTDVIAFAAAESSWQGPLHIDWFGHPMAERQMMNAVHANDTSLAEQWLYVLPALLRGDSFSGCSNAQRLAILGELGAAGRLNSQTCGTELVRVLKPPNPFSDEFVPQTETFLRGKIVPEDAAIILFTGGYNTWLDEETLFHAVERVLAREPSAVYVSTGGAIEGHVTVVYERFRQRVRDSPHSSRFHFPGWVRHDEFEQCCLEADVGVMCDLPTLEGELGCRNRLYGWLWGGMRAVATSLSEIQLTDLEPLGLVRGVPLGDPEALADALSVELRAGHCSTEEAAARRNTLTTACSPARFYAPLLQWAENPAVAPDRTAHGLPDNPLIAAQRQWLTSDKSELASSVAELLDRLEGSRAFRLAMARNQHVRELMERIRKTIS